MVTVAKGLRSGYAPLSAALVSEPVFEVMTRASDTIGIFSHGYTYSGHPLCAAAANAVLDILEHHGKCGDSRKILSTAHGRDLCAASDGRRGARRRRRDGISRTNGTDAQDRDKRCEMRDRDGDARSTGRLT